MSQMRLRVFKDGVAHRQATLQSPCVVDIYYNESLQPQLNREDDVIACIHWDGPTESSSTSFTITKPDWSTELSIDEDIYKALVNDRTILRTFLREIYNEAGIKLVCLRMHPLVFCFSHEDGNQFERNSKFKTLFGTFILNCTSRKTQIECKRQTLRHKRMCSEIDHGFEAGSRNGTQEKTEGDIECNERLTNINKEMLLHSKFIDEQFSSQQDEMKELMKSVQSLCENISSEPPSETTAELTSPISKPDDQTFKDQQAGITVVSLNEETVTPQAFDEHCRDTVSDDKRRKDERGAALRKLQADEQTRDAKSPGEHRPETRHVKSSFPKQTDLASSVTKALEDMVALPQTNKRREGEKKSEDTLERCDDSLADVSFTVNTSPTQDTSQYVKEGHMTEEKERKKEATSERIKDEPSSPCQSRDDAYDEETITLNAEDEYADEQETVETIQASSEDFDETGRDVSQSVLGSSPRNQSASSQNPRSSTDRPSQHQTGSVLDENTLDSFVGSIFVDDNADTRFLRGLNKVLVKDKHSVLKAEQCTDTMLCLDTSRHISPSALEEMKTAAHTFISGVEEVAADSDMEENIGIVSFGGQAKLLHLPTNDFGVLREIVDSLTCGGSAPLHQAAMLTLACLSDEKREVPNGPFVAMKTVVMTAGRPSAPTDETTGQLMYPNDQEKMRVMVTIREYGETLGESGAIKFIWIPIGEADRRFLGSMVRVSKGKMMEPNEIHQLSHFQKNRIIAQNVLKAMQGSESIIDSTELDTFIDVFGSDMTLTDKEEVKELVIEFLQTREVSESPSTDDFDNICDRGGRLFPLGSRVVRGPDWMWGDQDAEGPGTVINHVAGRDCVNVLWDSGHSNEYRCGCGMQYDLIIDNVCPRQYKDSRRAEIGVQVERGPDWSEKHDDEDGGEGNYGVIIRIKKQRVKVIWRNGSIKEYKFGENDQYEVQMRDATDYLLEMTSTFPDNSQAESTPSAKIETKPPIKNHVWQRRGEDGKWENYPPGEQDKLNTDFNNGRPSSLLIRGSKSFRVIFTKKIERRVSGKETTEIRRGEL